MDYFNELTKLLENGKETEAILVMKDQNKKFNKYQEFNGNTIMTFAIKKNLHLFANSLLNDELLINMPDVYGNPPLHLAINRNNEFLALQLLKLKCEHDIPNKNGMKPVFLALDKGMFEVVKSLVVLPENLNTTNTDGNNLLLTCIDKFSNEKNKDYCAFGEQLIHFGINVNYQNKLKDSKNYGENALTLALKKEAIDIAKLIIKKGEGLNIADKNEVRPLTLCMEKKYEKLGMNILEKNIDTGYFSNGDTFLTSAIKNEMHTISDFLVNKGMNLSSPDGNGNLPIGLAIERGFEKLTMKIYNHLNNSNNQMANSNEYPLTLAIKSNQVAIAEKLILIGKKNVLSVYNKDGESPFSIALKSKMDNLCNFMIDNGLDLNILSDNVETYLTLAIKNSRLEVAKNLLKKGIPIKANQKGQSPQQICQQLGMSNFLNVIENHINPQSNKVNMHRFNIVQEDIKTTPVKSNNVIQPPIEIQISEKEKRAEALRVKIKSML